MTAYWGGAASLQPRSSSAAHSPHHADVRRWQVLHLCRSVRRIAPVLDLQLATGMRPIAITFDGPAEACDWIADSGVKDVRAASPLSAWREVRIWRQRIAEAKKAVEIVHAHEFPAGMAGVRADVPLVYDVHRFVDEQAQVATHSWLARSFRGAEQFVFSRAGAVIVHSTDAYRSALRRGATTGNLFLIADTRPHAETDLLPVWVRTVAEKYDEVYAFVLNEHSRSHGPLLPPRWQPLAACF